MEGSSGWYQAGSGVGVSVGISVSVGVTVPVAVVVEVAVAVGGGTGVWADPQAETRMDRMKLILTTEYTESTEIIFVFSPRPL
jgi:hypothetical protein